MSLAPFGLRSARWLFSFFTVTGGLFLNTTLSARANVYATNLRLNGGTTNVALPVSGGNVTVSYLLNEAAPSGVTVAIKSSNTLVRSIFLAGGNPGTFFGANSVVWNGRDNASNIVSGGTYTIGVTASSPGYPEWTQISDDFSAGSYVARPRGIAVNRNTNSLYYGRVFVANGFPGPSPGAVAGDTVGILKLNADGSAAADGMFSTGGWLWGGNNRSPWKLEVAEDDGLYVNDWSSHGVVLRFNQTITTNAGQVVLRSDNWPNAGAANLSGLSVTVSGTNSQIWMADTNVTGGVGVRRWTMTNNTVATNDVGTTIVQAGGGSDLSLAPYDLALDGSNRVYAIQFRLASADAARRVMRFSATNTPPVTNADWKIGNGDDDMRGAAGVAVNPAGTLVAVAFTGAGTGFGRVGGAARVFSAANGVDVATFSPAAHHDHTDVAWDNVGNLYVCDNWDSLWRVFSPPGTNGATTTAVASVQVASPVPPVLSAPAYSNGQFQCTLTGQANVAYVIQVSTNLQDWTSVTTNAQAPTVRTIVVPAPSGESFYRALAQ